MQRFLPLIALAFVKNSHTTSTTDTSTKHVSDDLMKI